MINVINKYRSFLENFAYMYGVVIIQRLLGLVVTYFVVRLLSTTQYAEYNLIIGYLSLFNAFTLTGLGNAVMQSTARGKVGIYFQAQKLMFVAAIVSGLTFVAMAYIHKGIGGYNPELYIGLIIAGLIFPFYLGLTIWKNYRTGQKKFKQLSMIDGFTSIIVNTVIIFLLIGYGVNDYLFLIIAYMLLPAMINIIMFLMDFKSEALKSSKEKEDGMIKYGLGTSIYSAIHTIAFRLDSFALFYLISPSAMAIFVVANRLPEMLREMTQVVASILAPNFAQLSYISAEMNKFLSRYFFVFAVLVVVGTFTVYPFLMTLIFGEKYDNAILYSQAIMCSLIIGNIANINFRFIRSQADSKSYKNIMITVSLIKIVSVFILVPLFGIWGAVASIFIYRMSMMVIVKYVIHTKYLVPE